ncbi:MAG: Hsp70 family protein [Myxococcales bacterium]|nr:Hsp70 family protein [Myxococcales bacterium]
MDLGTTNSAAAVFDGDQVVQVRNSQGGTLTPSIVRIDGRGKVTVGARARRFLESDPDNTRGEFKRVMGTAQEIGFSAAELRRKPTELAAEVLRSLRGDIRDQFGFLPERAVISVPALFELPQSAATSEAARLAGFTRVELLQEPIASAIAAGWTAEESTGAWLVYDLGGGTFDASLLETRDGLLRVVGHDGDNFLGGRDFDWAIVDWALREFEKREGVQLSRKNPADEGAIRKIKLAAEDAKIELSRTPSADLLVPGIVTRDGAAIDLELTLDRTTLDGLCGPIVDRSLAVVGRLLAAHGLGAGGLTHVVLVGGPTVMPLVRARVHEALGVRPVEGLDPMGLVSQGAAIYAATAGLDARPEPAEAPTGQRVWLQFPAMSSDLTPHVVGRLVDPGRDAPSEVRLVRADGQWEGPWASFDDEGAFVTSVSLIARRPNIFRVEGRRADGSSAPMSPPTITIVQGLTISDPPLSRTIGVALANNSVRVYFERGAPLPAKRTFTLRTVEAVAQGASECLLKIPIVQGEYDNAHLCRLVGSLELRGEAVRESLPSGSEIEVTIELDRGGRLSARALVPALEQVFEEVASLLVPEASPEVLQANMDVTRKRVIELRGSAFRNNDKGMIERLNSVEVELAELDRDVDAALGGDVDAAQKARRAFLELEASLDRIELERRWPELERETAESVVWATAVIADLGQPHEQRLLDDAIAGVERARAAKDPLELQRQLRLVNRLGNTASLRHPRAWHRRFEHAASQIDQASDLVAARSLVKEGRAAYDKDDIATLRRVTQRLWQLLPDDVEARRLGHDSGVR